MAPHLPHFSGDMPLDRNLPPFLSSSLKKLMDSKVSLGDIGIWGKRTTLPVFLFSEGFSCWRRGRSSCQCRVLDGLAPYSFFQPLEGTGLAGGGGLCLGSVLVAAG